MLSHFLIILTSSCHEFVFLIILIKLNWLQLFSNSTFTSFYRVNSKLGRRRKLWSFEKRTDVEKPLFLSKEVQSRYTLNSFCNKTQNKQKEDMHDIYERLLKTLEDSEEICCFTLLEKTRPYFVK